MLRRGIDLRVLTAKVLNYQSTDTVGFPSSESECKSRMQLGPCICSRSATLILIINRGDQLREG
jgi:hypothetical protein